MTKQEKKSLCSGCRDNFYNQAGNSNTGECWMLKTARVCEKMIVGIWQNPPYKWLPQKTLSCHHREGGTTWISRDDCRLIENGAGKYR